MFILDDLLEGILAGMIASCCKDFYDLQVYTEGKMSNKRRMLKAYDNYVDDCRARGKDIDIWFTADNINDYRFCCSSMFTVKIDDANLFRKYIENRNWKEYFLTHWSEYKDIDTPNINWERLKFVDGKWGNLDPFVLDYCERGRK